MWGWPWAADRKTSDGQNLFQDPDWVRCDGRGPQESDRLSSHTSICGTIYHRSQIYSGGWRSLLPSRVTGFLSCKDRYLYVRGIIFRAPMAENTQKLRPTKQRVCGQTAGWISRRQRLSDESLQCVQIVDDLSLRLLTPLVLYLMINSPGFISLAHYVTLHSAGPWTYYNDCNHYIRRNGAASTRFQEITDVCFELMPS